MDFHFEKVTDHPVVTSARLFSTSMVPYWAAAALVAVISIVFAKVFKIAEDFSFNIIGRNSLYAFITAPIAIMASTMLADFFSSEAGGSGIPQLIAGVEMSEHPNSAFQRLFGIRMAIAKFVGSCICVAGGGVTGREGPNLQISAAVFNQVHKRWPARLGKTEIQPMILAGGAAGLAAAFNTPLGGIVFAIEELAKVHISRVRTAIFHAVVIAGLLTQQILGNYLYLTKSDIHLHGFLEFLELLAASIFIGVAGALFGLLCVKGLTFRRSLPVSKRLVFSFMCSLLIATLIYFRGDIAFGSGRGLLTRLLTDPDQSVSLDVGFVRFASNLFTYIAGVIGGIFAPALSTGAGMGLLIGKLLASENLRLWITGGMAAFLTGVTRTPFTSSILVLEMTGADAAIVPLMAAAMTAYGAAKFVDQKSFYERASENYLK